MSDGGTGKFDSLSDVDSTRCRIHADCSHSTGDLGYSEYYCCCDKSESDEEVTCGEKKDAGAHKGRPHDVQSQSCCQGFQVVTVQPQPVRALEALEVQLNSRPNQERILRKDAESKYQFTEKHVSSM